MLKKIILSFFLTFFLFTGAEARTLDEILKSGVLKMGVNPGLPPLAKYDEKNNLEDKICMISNSDIYLYECDVNLLTKLHDNNTVFSLTRYEHDLSRPMIDSFIGSHDCFIFKSKLNNFINSIEKN